MHNDDIDLDKLAERFAEVEHLLRPGTDVRWAYFQLGDGPMFCWNTERLPDGSWESFVYEPDSDGGWTLAEGSVTSHRLRREAKARAVGLFQGWSFGAFNRKPW